MKIPTLAILDSAGALVWTGSALDFARANSLDADARRDLCATLRGSPDRSPEPWTVGGGAAEAFDVLLVTD